MNEYPKRYELKLRNAPEGKNRSYKQQDALKSGINKTENDRISFRTGFCTVLLLFVVFLKVTGGEGSENILSKVDSIINSQFDMNKTAEVVSEFVYDATNYFSGNNKEISLSLPVKNATLHKDFVESVHPVFMTDIAPTGISFSAPASSYVYSSESGRVSTVTENSDGTKRVVVKYDKNMSVAYDNLANAYVKQDDLVAQEQIIGLTKEEEPSLLEFEVWVDNVAVNPLEYLVQIPSDEAE